MNMNNNATSDGTTSPAGTKNAGCFQCDHLYKDIDTGYRGSGRRGILEGFYSEEGFPGYCSWSCFLVAEGTTDPASRILSVEIVPVF